MALLPDQPQDLRAPVAGMLEVSENSSVTIATTGIDVVVPITGIQQLRLSSIDINGDATVETVVGQRTIACDALWVDPHPPDRVDGVDAASALRCRLPRTVETAPRLRAALYISSVVIEDATVVPDVMLGQDGSGYTVAVIEDGKEIVIPVDVGPSDGVVRVIYSDLPIGATIVDPGQ